MPAMKAEAVDQGEKKRQRSEPDVSLSLYSVTLKNSGPGPPTMLSGETYSSVGRPTTAARMNSGTKASVCAARIPVARYTS
jgi:hypothetical protein